MSEGETALGIGAIMGGDLSDSAWLRSAVRPLMKTADTLSASVSSALQLRVVYHFPGRHSPNEFEGVRTGPYSAKRAVLTVQASVPADADPEHPAVLYDLLEDAVSLAESVARKKKLADSLPELTALARAARAESNVGRRTATRGAPLIDDDLDGLEELVLQFAVGDTLDYDAVIEIENLLFERLAGKGQIDGHDVGQGFMNVFIWTNDSQSAFATVRELLSGHLAIHEFSAGYREAASADFTSLWPAGSSEFELR